MIQTPRSIEDFKALDSNLIAIVDKVSWTSPYSAPIDVCPRKGLDPKLWLLRELEQLMRGVLQWRVCQNRVRVRPVESKQSRELPRFISKKMM